MRATVLAHVRANVIGYLALFVALGGTSYAAVRLKPGSVTSSALATRAVTHAKLDRNSVTSLNVKAGTLAGSDFKSGTLVKGAIKGPKGDKGDTGARGGAGATGPQGLPGGASVGARARFSGSVAAPKGASTAVPLSGNTWTQVANEVDLMTGSMTVQIPASCTGSFGNALVVNVDGTATTFALAPTAPASTTVTMPFNVGTLSEAAQATPHTVTASFGNSCTKDGETFTISDVHLDVIRVP
jgi:hypothetical protein